MRDVVYAIAREAGLTSQREDPLLLRQRIVHVSCQDSTGDIQWAIDVVTTDPQKGHSSIYRLGMALVLPTSMVRLLRRRRIVMFCESVVRCVFSL